MLPIRRPGKSVNHIGVALEHAQVLAGGSVPEADGAVVSR